MDIVIGVDIDGVVRDFVREVIVRYVPIYVKKFKLNSGPLPVTSWNFENYNRKIISDLLSNRIPLLENAPVIIHGLHLILRLLDITDKIIFISCQGGNGDYEFVTSRWIESRFFDMFVSLNKKYDVVFTRRIGEKYKYVDILFDDSPTEIEIMNKQKGKLGIYVEWEGSWRQLPKPKNTRLSMSTREDIDFVIKFLKKNLSDEKTLMNILNSS